jgi:hypothetical protein
VRMPPHHQVAGCFVKCVGGKQGLGQENGGRQTRDDGDNASSPPAPPAQRFVPLAKGSAPPAKSCVRLAACHAHGRGSRAGLAIGSAT